MKFSRGGGGGGAVDLAVRTEPTAAMVSASWSPTPTPAAFRCSDADGIVLGAGRPRPSAPSWSRHGAGWWCGSAVGRRAVQLRAAAADGAPLPPGRPGEERHPVAERDGDDASFAPAPLSARLYFSTAGAASRRRRCCLRTAQAVEFVLQTDIFAQAGLLRDALLQMPSLLALLTHSVRTAGKKYAIWKRYATV